MFEDDIDGNGIPCDHPITFLDRIFARLHELFGQWHAPHLCDAYDRVVLQYPCAQCEGNRYTEYGALFGSDKDVLKRWGREDYE